MAILLYLLVVIFQINGILAGMKFIVPLLFVRFFPFGMNLFNFLVCANVVDMVLIWSFDMTFTFRYRFGPFTDIYEGEHTIYATNLTEAVEQFKDSVSDFRNSKLRFVVSYFYLCVDDFGKSFLGEFTESFYKKHFGGK